MKRSDRFTAVSGLIAVILLVVGTLLFGFYEYLPAPETVQAHLADNATRVLVGASLGVLAAFFLIWFAGAIKVRVRAAEGPGGPLTAVALAGTVVAAASLVVTYSGLVAIADRARQQAIDAAVVTAAYDAYGSLIVAGSAVGLAAMLFAWSVTALRAKTAPAWVVWLTVFIALGTVSPLSYIFVAVAFLWVAVASAVFTFRRAGGPTAT